MPKLIHVTTCPNCFKRVEIECSEYGKDIAEFLKDLYKYKEQIGFQVHHTLNLVIEKWEERK